MRIAEGNPERNQLGFGIKEEELKATIAKSGYPLQITVERILAKNGFYTYPEWTYVDTQSNSERNIDILAMWSKVEKEEKLKVIPSLDLLVECKRSDLPYVFFLLDIEETYYDVITCAGLKKEAIDVKLEGVPLPLRTYLALGLDILPFSNGKINRCMSFTKCVRDSKLTLSGEGIFNEIVLPLIKAANHFALRAKAPKNAKILDCHAVVCLAVVDAPMIGVIVNDDKDELIAVPWVRVVRSIVKESDIWYGEENEIFIDIVHRDYLDMYIKNHLLPFVGEFSKRVLENQNELFRCEAYDGEIMMQAKRCFNTLE